jgi:hypothetical protein
MRMLLPTLGLLMLATPALARDSDTQIKQKIIRESISDYPGNCPCPYNSASNGSRCGGRSAWSRAGGYAPKCYPADVTAAEVVAYRTRNGG